jgi:hypothetical protein
MATATPATFVAAQDLSNVSATLLYTSPTSGKGSRIDAAVVNNHSGAAKTINLYAVPFAGTAGTSNILLQTLSLAAGETRILFEVLGLRLAPGDFLAGDASAAASTNIRVSGVEFTG